MSLTGQTPLPCQLRRASQHAAPRRCYCHARAAARGCVAAQAKRAAAPAKAKDSSDDGYLFGLNDTGRNAAAPQSGWDKFWYDFYFKAPEQSAWEKQLQAFADAKFKGLRTWKTVHAELRAAGTRTLPPGAAAAAATQRPGPFGLLGGPAAVILDVREPEFYEKAHAAGALNVPLYRPLEEPRDGFDRLRQVYFALFGLRVPVRNDAFAADVLAVVKRKDAPIILMCQTGGTLETAAERKIRAPRMPAPVYGKYGAASRSLMAAHELLQAGFTRVSHAEGGFSKWRSDGQEVEAA